MSSPSATDRLWAAALCALCACSGVAQNPDRDALRAGIPSSMAPVAKGSEKPAAATAAPTQGPPAPSAAAEEPAAQSKTPVVAPAEAKPAEAKPAEAKSAEQQKPATEASATPASSGAAEQAAPAQDPKVEVLLPVALVEGQPIDVRRFLARMWIRDSLGAREILDQLVVSQIALREAERLGIRISPEKVDEGLQRAMEALEARLKEKGWTKGVEAHVKERLGLTMEAYKRELRNDTIVQMLAERAVRTYAMENERAAVRLMEVEGRDNLDLVRQKLAEGGDFEELCKQYGSDELSKKGGARLLLVRSETSSLTRLAFATPEGQVGGPIEEGGRYLLCKVEKRMEPRNGPWTVMGPVVEASLAADPVDDLEFAQWKSAAGKRYEIDLSPFLELIGERKP